MKKKTHALELPPKENIFYHVWLLEIWIVDKMSCKFLLKCSSCPLGKIGTPFAGQISICNIIT